ncbi:hypothetical protein EDD18DRAFT_1105656 [Armillaria luteobubalina]|uniref:Heterokaryon incompatibility domain-containing protein n=1 Tax=Armillaria luteobubalina TaxID=153913 RepID=A0AA39Q5C6_9AGAR|nr:hypothetical protein EDD18DRAFT_1105656 [Armillaria luteobubalina]
MYAGIQHNPNTRGQRGVTEISLRREERKASVQSTMISIWILIDTAWEATLLDLPDPLVPANRTFYFKAVKWLGGKHDGYMLAPMKKYLAVRKAQLRTVDEMLVNFQCLFTFGLLESVFERKVPEKLLLSVDSEGNTWRHVQQFSQQYPDRYRRWAERVEEDLTSLETLVYRLASFCASRAEEVAPYFVGMASVAVTVASFRGALFAHGMSAVPKKPGHSFPVSSFFPHIKDAVCSKGRCPLAIKRFLESSIILLEYTGTSKPPIHHGADCTEEACTRNTIDISTYTRKHVMGTCNCAYTKPPISDVYDLLQGGRIPVIQRMPNGTLCITDASKTPYIAISHVWVDGLGSTSEVGLPTCQIERIADLVHTLLPGGAFWIDSVCIPEVRELRKEAIRRMTLTYANARAVLVTDAGIRSRSLSSPLEDTALAILTSGWMQRLWTLQEGLLVKKLIFQLSDGFAPLDNLFPDAVVQWCNPVLSHCLSEIVRFTRRRNPALSSIPDARIEFTDLVRFLVGRWTSRPEDETIAVCGLLNVDPIKFFDVQPSERLKTLLLQLRQLPGDIIFMDCPKMEDEPGFRWTPKSLIRSDSRVGHECRAVCTADGLEAEYCCAQVAQVVRVSAGVPVKLFVKLVPQDQEGTTSQVLNATIERPTRSYAFNTVLLEKYPETGHAWVKGVLGLLSDSDAVSGLRGCEYQERSMFFRSTERAMRKCVAEDSSAAVVVEATLETLRLAEGMGLDVTNLENDSQVLQVSSLRYSMFQMKQYFSWTETVTTINIAHNVKTGFHPTTANKHEIISTRTVSNPTSTKRGRKPFTPLLTIAVLSRVIYGKGVDFLIATAPRIYTAFPDVYFIVDPRPIRLNNFRSVLIRGAIFLNTSLTESFGITILEAACAESLWSLRKMSYIGGYRGSYLKHDPIHALERIKTFYDWAQVAECTEIVYDTVVKSRQMVLCERVKRVVRPSRSLKILLDRMMGLGPFERPIYLIILVGSSSRRTVDAPVDRSMRIRLSVFLLFSNDVKRVGTGHGNSKCSPEKLLSKAAVCQKRSSYESETAGLRPVMQLKEVAAVMARVFAESFKPDDILQEYTWTLPVIQDAEKFQLSLLRELRNGGINETSTCSAMITDLLRLQSYLSQYDLEISRLQSYLPWHDLGISQLKRTLYILSVTKHCINQCSLFYQSSLAPIRRLPVEILGIVFEEACTLPIFGVSSPVTLPTTISICLSTPSVWSNITARHTSDSSSLIARINHYQSMSLNHALTFDFTAAFDKASQKEIASASQIVTPSFLDRCSTGCTKHTASPYSWLARARDLAASVPTSNYHTFFISMLFEFVVEVRRGNKGHPRQLYRGKYQRDEECDIYVIVRPIITNPFFSVSRLTNLEIILTSGSQLPAVILLNDLHYGLLSRPDPPAITSLSLQCVPISDAVLIKILDRIPLLRKLSIIESGRMQRSKHLPVITERYCWINLFEGKWGDGYARTSRFCWVAQEGYNWDSLWERDECADTGKAKTTKGAGNNGNAMVDVFVFVTAQCVLYFRDFGV